MSMNEIFSLQSMPPDFVDDPLFQSKMMTRRLGDQAGSERLYVNVDSVKPGAKSAKYHSHSSQEEFFLILRGSGSLRLQGRVIPVKEGDFFAKPAGRGIAHQFVNDGDGVLEILDCGTREKHDVVEYPDEDALYVKDQGLVFEKKKAIEGWSSDPDLRDQSGGKNTA
jgi:uncharacterized cupin superfamily protein